MSYANGKQVSKGAGENGNWQRVVKERGRGGRMDRKSISSG